MGNIIQRARMFATAAHADQKRKYTHVPYITHPEAVAGIVASVDGTDEMIAAAYLHDVIEDTSVQIGEIMELFGPDVAFMVDMLTDNNDLTRGNRAMRKAESRNRLMFATDEIKTIKLADLIDNTASIIEHDKNFAKVYMQEVKLLLVALYGGNKTLLHQLADIVRKWEEAKANV